MTEKCSNCEHMKKENSQLRKALGDTNKNYVEVVNENLALKRELESARSVAFPPEPRPVPLKVDPALITYPKIAGSEPSIWERFVSALRQEKDKWK